MSSNKCFWKLNSGRLSQRTNTLQLVTAKGHRRCVQKLACYHQSERTSETWWRLDSSIMFSALHPSDPGHTTWAHTSWCFRIRGYVGEWMTSVGEWVWVNALWFQAVMFLSCKSSVLYSAFKHWLISDRALHALECRLCSADLRHVPWDRHGHLPSCFQHNRAL